MQERTSFEDALTDAKDKKWGRIKFNSGRVNCNFDKIQIDNVDDMIDAKLNSAVVALVKQISDQTDMIIELRDQISYLKGYTKALCSKYEELDEKIMRLK